MGTRLCCLLATLLLAGCASRFGEHHYFKSEDGEGAPVNYYRVTVRGGTFLSNSRYLSGYFDEEAVDTYFSQASTGKGFPPASKGKLQPVDEALRDRKLVLILSANSDAMAGEIGQIADNAALMGGLTQLVAGAGLLSPAQQALRRQQERAQSLARAGLGLLGGLPVQPSQAQAQGRALELANRLASELGREQPFRSLGEAQTWLNANRGRLLKEDLP